VTVRTATRPVMVMLDYGPRRVKTSAQDAQKIQAGGSTALILAAQGGGVESARLLLAAGANANDVGGDGKSALVMAAFSGQTEVARLLLASGADPNAAGAGYTALHAAALRGDVELVKALLEKGANPHATQTKGSPVRRFGSQWTLPSSFNGGSPLIVAAAYLETEVMRLLLAAGAKADATLPDGLSALQLAVAEQVDQSARPSDLSRFNVIDNDTPVVPRPVDVVAAAVRMLLDAGASVEHADAAGNTALHAAAFSNQPSIISLLVERGAQVNTKNKDGQTPLFFTLPRKPAGRGAGFPGYPEAEAALRKLGAKQE